MPEQQSGLLSRRNMLGAGALAVGLTYLGLQNGRPAPRTKEAIEREQRVLKMIRDHKPASVEKLKRTPAGDESLIVFTLDDGGHLAETLLHLDNEGKISEWTRENLKHRLEMKKEFEERTDEEEETISGTGSGFITEQNGSVFIVSNNHVLRGAAPSIKNLMTVHPTSDLAAVPGALVRRCDKDEYALPFVPISKIPNDQLNGRMVAIQGMGSFLMRAEGPALFMSETPSDSKDYKGLQGSFALVVGKDVIEPFECAGMSGSRVEDSETGEVVGVFDSVSEIEGVEDKFLMVFSGPEQLRQVIATAQRDAVKNASRFDLTKLLQQPKKDPNVVPAGAQGAEK